MANGAMGDRKMILVDVDQFIRTRDAVSSSSLKLSPSSSPRSSARTGAFA